MNAIILAAGRATRLGPLAAQFNKCLITVGQQPMLAHQVNVLRAAGVKSVVVVASTESRSQVEDVAQHAYGKLGVAIDVIVQTRGTSPVNALVDGLEHLIKQGCAADPTYVLAADTLLDSIPEVDAIEAAVWAHAERASGDMIGTRTWTVREANGLCWTDRAALGPEPVYTGLLCIKRPITAYAVLAPKHVSGTTFGMASAMTMLDAQPLLRDLNWQDVGDLGALAEARRSRYIARDSHRMELDNDGIVWKIGKVEDEIHYLESIPADARLLFPRVHVHTVQRYGTEHIDQPTLSELWLYWPGDETMWVSILQHLCARVARTLWYHLPAEPDLRDEMFWRHQAIKMYVDQLVERLHAWKHPLFDLDALIVNGDRLLAGRALIDSIRAEAVEVAQRCVPTLIHGDLSFMNILWSVTTGQPKLLDPRGSFGKHRGPCGDMRYDLAKLRYSYNGGVAAILHGLFDIDVNVDTGIAWVDLPRATQTMCGMLDDVLRQYTDVQDIRKIEAIMCLSGSTVHQSNESESLALYTRGVELAHHAFH